MANTADRGQVNSLEERVARLQGQVHQYEERAPDHDAVGSEVLDIMGGLGQNLNKVKFQCAAMYGKGLSDLEKSEQVPDETLTL